MPAKKYTEGQRLEFMALIDRGGSVRAAAVAVGAHPDAGYKWMKQAGLSTPRSTQRKYTDAQKAEFLHRLGEVGNVSEVARELELNRVTCYVWAHTAGTFTAEYSDAKREQFLRLRREEVSRRAGAGAGRRGAPGGRLGHGNPAVPTQALALAGRVRDALRTRLGAPHQ